MLYTQHIPCICIYLDISSPKSMVLHIEWVTTGEHNPAIQVWLKLNSLEGVDVVSLPVRNEVCLQNLIEFHCTPGLGGVRSERYVQLFSIVVSNPLSQFLRKKLQHRMAGTVHVRNCLMLPCQIGLLSWHTEELLLQQHNVQCRDRIVSLNKQIHCMSVCSWNSVLSISMV